MEAIEEISKSLVSYGYSSFLLSCELQIVDENFNEVVEKRKELQTLKKQWIKGIKHLYANSFLLTHFTGSTLVEFVDAVLSSRYYPSLSNILNLDEPSF